MGMLHPFRGQTGRSPARRSILQRSRWRPRLEVLEGRCLPSTVTNLADAGAGSLRQAIIDTPAAGTVDFQDGLSGTITLTTGELLINKDLTIAGPGADAITVSGNHASRVFEIAAMFTVRMSGLTLADGSDSFGGGGIFNAGTLTVSASSLYGNSTANFGGGVFNVGTLTVIASTLSGNSTGYVGGGIYSEVTLTVTASTLSGNSSGAGGGIYNDGTLTVATSTLSGNSASSYGGGIDIGSGMVAVTASTFSGNSANQGGGIYKHNGTLTVTASTLSGNCATGGGGGLYDGGGIFNSFGTLTVSASTFRGNSAATFGGGIFNDATLTVSASSLEGNSATLGGGIYNNFGVLTITASTLSGNSATGQGGGIYSEATLTVTASTLSGNAAAIQAGGIYRSPLFGDTTLRNTLLAGNNAPVSPDDSGIFHSQGHNLIGDGTGSTGFIDSDLVGTADHPIDPLLAPLNDNGGPTLTMALLPDSPAIDAGESAGLPQWDQRGPSFRRIVNGAADIGAFEVQSIESPLHGPIAMFALPPCGRCSSQVQPLGFTFDFFGRHFDTVWVNSNGTVSFDGPFGGFVPGPLGQTGRALLVPYWADVSTDGAGLGRVTYGQGTLDGDPAFGATWEDVAPFHPAGLSNTFQVVIANHTARLGYYEVQFNYFTLRWDRADSSAEAARAGYANGAGASGELPGSGTFNTLLDGGAQSLQVLRRYTLIIYPSTGGNPAPGDALRLASTISHDARTVAPPAEASAPPIATPPPQPLAVDAAPHPVAASVDRAAVLRDTRGTALEIGDELLLDG